MSKEFAIGMLWVEGPMSFLEQLCIKSFVDAGQHVCLYTYSDVTNIPDGVEVRDARDVLPATEFVIHTRTGSVAPHADKFRYRMLAKEPDLIWADTDAYCVRPFTTGNGHFHGWLAAHEINNGVLRLPLDSPTLHDLIAQTQNPYSIPEWLPANQQRLLEEARDAGQPRHAGEMPWGVWGPRALTWLLHRNDEAKYSLPQHALYPVSYGRRRLMAQPDRDCESMLKDDTFSVHLYGRRMRRLLITQYDGRPEPDSFIARLLSKHGIDPAAAPLQSREAAPEAEPETAEMTAPAIAPVLPPDRKRYSVDEIAIPDLPPLSVPADAIIAEFPDIVRPNAIKRLDPFLRMAEQTLSRLRARGAYGIDTPPADGFTRGYDYYGSDAARTFALGTSLNRYSLNHGRIPDLLSPGTVTEKLLVAKMFAEIPDGPPADKLMAERFVPRDVVHRIAPVRRVWIGTTPDLPDNDLVPPGRYFLKTNFGAGNNIPVTFPLSDDDRAPLLERTDYWFERRHLHGFWAGEWWYHTVSPRLFLEENLAEEGQDIADWKFWVTAGKLQIVQVDKDRSANHVQKVFDRDFRLTPHELYYPTGPDAEPKPPCFDDMVATAEAIGRDLEFARVDFYVRGDVFHLGEITLCPFGGKKRIRSAALDRSMGAGWRGSRLFPDDGPDGA